MGLPVRVLNECTVVSLPEEIDIGNADVVRDGLIEVLDRGTPGVVIDMSMTVFCDSAGAEAVLRAHERAQVLGSWVRLVVRARPVRKVFNILGIDTAIPVSASLAEALAVRGAGGNPTFP